MLGIIIPSYGRLNELDEALSSLCLQTNKRFITIVVNDGSTEDYSQIISKYEDKLNLKYLSYNDNGGPAKARQTGLNWAISKNLELVMFLDSDDLLCPNAVERLTYEINHNKAAVITSVIASDFRNAPGYTIDNDSNLTWLHGKIYRVSFLKKHHIAFDFKIKTNEDLAFNNCCYYAAKKNKDIIKSINDQLYIWRQKDNSITHDDSNNCAGVDYIHSTFSTLMYMNIYECFDISFIRNVMSCYLYYQVSIEKGKPITDDVKSKVKFMLNYPPIKKKLFDTKTLNKNSDTIMQYMVDGSKIYWFKQSYFDWLKEYIDEDNMH